MIAVDTSTWIAFLQGDGGEDVEMLDRALQDRQVLMAPVVLTEVLSDPKLSAEVSQTLSELPLIEVSPGYWQRAGELRAKVLAKRHKARLGDALIAQSCIDRGIPLLTRDRDFRAFAEAAGLDLPIGSVRAEPISSSGPASLTHIVAVVPSNPAHAVRGLETSRPHRRSRKVLSLFFEESARRAPLPPGSVGDFHCPF